MSRYKKKRVGKTPLECFREFSVKFRERNGSEKVTTSTLKQAFYAGWYSSDKNRPVKHIPAEELSADELVELLRVKLKAS